MDQHPRLPRSKTLTCSSHIKTIKMRTFYRIVISDYKQRTRSYAFLITLAISLYFAYSFIPAADANYTTVRIGNYVGVQNAAWIGYVTAMMTSVFLSMT